MALASYDGYFAEGLNLPFLVRMACLCYLSCLVQQHRSKKALNTGVFRIAIAFGSSLFRYFKCESCASRKFYS